MCTFKMLTPYPKSTIFRVYLVSQMHGCWLFSYVHTFASGVWSKKYPPLSVRTLRVFFLIEVKETNEHIDGLYCALGTLCENIQNKPHI